MTGSESDVCPQGCLNRLAPTCVVHRPSAEKDAPWWARLVRWWDRMWADADDYPREQR